MSKILVALGMSVVALGGAVTAQQAKPDFNGRWVLAPDKSTPPGTAAILGNSVNITQTATTVSVVSAIAMMKGTMVNGQMVTEQVETTTTTVFTVDAVEHDLERTIAGMEMAAAPGAVVSMPAAQKYRASWTDVQLVVIITTAPGQLLFSARRMALALEADGSMTVENLSIAQPRPGTAKQDTPTLTRNVYNKG